jgi:hypothetical protein
MTKVTRQLSTSNVAMNAWLLQASYSCDDFSESSGLNSERLKDRVGYDGVCMAASVAMRIPATDRCCDPCACAMLRLGLVVNGLGCLMNAQPADIRVVQVCPWLGRSCFDRLRAAPAPHLSSQLSYPCHASCSMPIPPQIITDPGFILWKVRTAL